MGKFILDTDVLTARAGELLSLQQSFDDLISELNSISGYSFEDFDFGSAINAITSNIESASIKVNNTAQAIINLIDSHMAAQKSYVSNIGSSSNKTSTTKSTSTTPTQLNNKESDSSNGSDKSTQYTNVDSSSVNTSNKSEVKSYIWNYLKSKGYSDASAAAIIGNIQQESDFVVNNSGMGNAKGLCQWEGSRFTDLKSYASKNGKDWTDIQVQLDFMESEMADNFKSYTGWTKSYSSGANYGWSEKVTLDSFKNNTNINEATQIFEQVFERASIPRMSTRQEYANAVYNEFAK